MLRVGCTAGGLAASSSSSRPQHQRSGLRNGGRAPLLRSPLHPPTPQLLHQQPHHLARASFLESLTSTIRRTINPEQGSKGAQQKGPVPPAKLVFVAGATGRCGGRVVRELLQAGYAVRAGVRSVDGARAELEVAEAYGLLNPGQIQRLQLVPFDLTRPADMREAIGGATRWGLGGWE